MSRCMYTCMKLPFFAALLTWLLVDVELVGTSYRAAVAVKYEWYAMEPFSENPQFQLSIASFGSMFNVVNILIFLCLIWVLCSFRIVKD